jgi:hypothetical protein
MAVKLYTRILPTLLLPFVMFLSTASTSADVIYEGCRNKSECNDGVFCNGEEVCAVTRQRNSQGVIVKEVGVCQAGTNPCDRGWQCRNAEAVCLEPCEDRDGDGFKAITCGGDDCDDRDPNRYPGNTEICDASGIDEDCDPRTVGSTDLDGDGFLSPLCR